MVITRPRLRIDPWRYLPLRPRIQKDTIRAALQKLSDGLGQPMKAEGDIIAPESPDGLEDRKNGGGGET